MSSTEELEPQAEGSTSMHLRSFIRQALCDIVEGVREAQTDTKDSGAAIVPLSGALVYGTAEQRINAGTGVVQRVEFDIALDESSGKGGEGGIGVWLGPLALGARGQTETMSSARSRLRFAVPVAFPCHKDG